MWSLFPVKYTRPAPQLPGSRTRMSAWIRAARITVAFVSPAKIVSFTFGIDVNARIAAGGSGDVTRRSRSPTVSRIRRALPAIEALSIGAFFRRCARISSAIGHATASRVLDCPSSWRRIASRIRCSVFSPKPFSRRIWRFSAAFFRSLTSVIPRLFQRMLAFFGPSPRSFITSTSPRGNSVWSSSSALTFPSRRYWSIFSAIASPTPWICRSRGTPPCFHSLSMSSGIASISRAARRYAIGRNRSSPFISRRSAMSYRTCATSAFRTARGTAVAFIKSRPSRLPSRPRQAWFGNRGHGRGSRQVSKLIRPTESITSPSA